jgi:hypothetical protein
MALYFDSDVRDTDNCSMTVKGSKIIVDEKISNPSMSCPDMFSWKLFAEAVKEQFWSRWASDEQTWPLKPYPLCENGKTGPNCCSPGASTNPGYEDTSHPEYQHSLYCPYFPGDHEGLKALQATPRRLKHPFGAHAIFLGKGGLASGLGIKNFYHKMYIL